MKTKNIQAVDPVPEGGCDPLEHVSASRLKSFLECRWKFYLERVLGLKSPANPNLHIGKSTHSGLEFFHHAVWRGEDVTADDVVGAYQQAYADLETAEPVDYGDKKRDDCIGTGERVLRAYLDSEHAQDKRRILGVEVWLKATLPDLPLPLVGVMDLVREGGGPVAIDFKTVGATPDLRAEAWANQIQMVMYHLLLRDAVGEEPDATELVYLVKLKKAKVLHQRLQVTPVQIQRFRALIDTYVDGISRGDFHPCPGMHCRWCSWHSECESFSGRQNLLTRAA